MKTPTKQTSHRLAAVLSLAFAATGAWAEDRTVSANTTLTEDLTVDALTVNSGVTLDLNGHKLTCTSIDGSGTITSLGTDLTAPGGTCAKASPAEVQGGSVAALFDDVGQTSYSTSHRILLDQNDDDQKLPLRVDYNFGDGNAKVVNAYKIWAAWSKRAPKAWTLYGSNNDSAYGVESDDGWVKIDSRQNETSWTQGSSNITPEDHVYFCNNSTSYRYYRLSVTAHNGGNQYFEIVQLEYFCATPGELHVNVADGETATVGSLTISGNVKVVKDGAGTLVASGDLTMTGGLNVNEGALVVKSGTVTVSGGYMYIGNASGKTAEVQVDGGTLSVGQRLVVSNTGTGTLTINGGAVTVNSSYDTYIADGAGSLGTINLNGGTFVTRRVLKNTNVATRILNFNGGTLKTTGPVQQNGIIANGVTVNVGEKGGVIDSGNSSDATSGSRVYVAAALGQTGDTGAMTFKGGKTINVEGAVNYTGGTIVELGTKIVANATTARDSILANLVVDGNGVTEVGDYTVFQYSGGTLDATDLANVSFVNCGPATTKEIVDGNTIVVHFSPLAFTLDADKTWSELIGAISLTSDVVVPITVMDSDAKLTVDKNVSVGQIEFTTGDGATLKINEGYTLTTGDITGAGGILNNGTIVKTGDGTATWPFDNNSTGITQINAGTVKVKSVANTGKTKYGFRPDDTSQQLIDVKAGATFDMNGIAEFIPSVRLAEGAHFVNTGSTIGYNKKQTVQLILDGDADVSTTGGDFGLIAPDHKETRLDLGSNTLTLDGTSTFRLSNTTINGTGTINVKSGTLTITSNPVTGENCTLAIGSGGKLNIGHSLSVTNFTNGGSTITGTSTLTVTGILTPGNAAISKLTLTDGAKVKATGTAQTVSTTFSASGTVYIDASDITREQLVAATDERIPVLTVPSVPSGVTWDVAGTLPVEGCRAKWVDNTLYLCKPTGLMIIFR